jgi:predicted alpha/beta hydrolase
MIAAHERWIAASDGFRLHLVELVPSAEARAVAVLGHAMMVDGRTLYRDDRPSLARTLAEAGIVVIVADLRGHGASGPVGRHARHSYEELVDDVGSYIAHARALRPELPLTLVGNSLFGHASLAHLGLHPEAPVARVVGFAVNIWNKRWTSSRTRWWKKQALVAASAVVTRSLGYLPVERLGLGTTDEPLAYWRSMLRWVPGDRWDGAEGDYAALLGRVQAPLLAVVSDGDKLLCHPDDGALFVRALGRCELLRLGPGCAVPELRGLTPGHVEMVSHPRCEPLWRHVGRWIVREGQAATGTST